VINENFEPNFNAVLPIAIVFQQPVKAPWTTQAQWQNAAWPPDENFSNYILNFKDV
jgi:hypothetical protein